MHIDGFAKFKFAMHLIWEIFVFETFVPRTQCFHGARET
jgi:hypothetical protein